MAVKRSRDFQDLCYPIEKNKLLTAGQEAIKEDIMMEHPSTSPSWNTPTKLVVVLTLLAIVATLLSRFENIVPPLIVVFILAYLLNPVAYFLTTRLHVSWQIAVTIVYALIVLALLGLLSLGGVGVIQQIRSLIDLIQQSLVNLQGVLKDISGREIPIGPFMIDLRKMDLSVLGNQLLGAAQPLIGNTGTMLQTVAGGAANFLGWTVFVLLESYFVLAGSNGLWKGLLQINIPGYASDLERMSQGLDHIWNAFLRGQIIIMALAAVVYTVVLNVLGVNYALGLALLAGLARFIPYFGSFTVWSTLFLVAFFQGYNPFGLEPWVYGLIVVAFAWFIDMVIDNFVAPNIMARALKVHPAAVLVAAIVGLNLLGILGVIIAAPMLATLQLIGRYFVRKLFDLDPWAGMEEMPPQPSLGRQIRDWLNATRQKLKLG
jgi:predicted PurR-regulated permease PerM